MKFVLTLALLFVAGTADAQLVIQGGASNMFMATGGGVSYYTHDPDTQTDVGIGVYQNRFVFGADYRFKYHKNCVIAIGDYQEYLSVIGAGLAVTNRGIATQCGDPKKQLVRFFVGEDGALHSIPYFTTTSNTGHFGSGVSLQKFITKNLEFDAVSAIAGSQRAVLEGIKYKWRNFHVDEAAGLTLGHGYFQGDETYQTQHFSEAVSRADFVGLTSYTSEGASVGTGPVSAFASAFQSPTARGEAIGGQVAHGPATIGFYELFSPGQRQSIGTITEHARHFTLTQFVSHSNGTTSANFGGGYTGNTLSATVGYQEVFNPLYGFQKATTIQFGLQLPRVTIHLMLDVLPTGVTYAGWGNAYVRGPALGAGTASQTAE